MGLVLTAMLLVALVAAPDAALAVLWNAAIPVLPATFLISPTLWRNVCPLATLNLMGNRFGARRALDAKLLRVAGVVGIVLLALLVPARRFLFNTEGVILAAVIVAVASLAVLLGVVFDMKAGFCNAICPVLPVERLYGQSPLAGVGNARCASCTSCTMRGCLDLAPQKSIAQVLGRSRRSHLWLHSGYGAFAAAFPGFVAGYDLTQDGPLSSAGTVYLTVAAWAVLSYLTTYVVARVFRLSATVSMRLLAVAAIGLYYWFAAPVVSTALALPGWAPAVIRGAAFSLIGFWLLRGGFPALSVRNASAAVS
jgi:hypothetical protein